MNVTTEDFKSIRPGHTEVFVCENANKMQSAGVMIARAKRSELPKGVVDYEYRTEIREGVCIMLIRALREGDQKVLNR